MQRIKRQSGRSVQLNWRDFQFEYVFTPAGLLESRPATDKAADLILSVKEDSPLELFRLAVSGQRPSVRIEGDVQLAAEVNWLVEHVRWDPEEDLARIFGDTTAHILADFGRNAITALKKFVQSQRREPSTTPHHQDHS